MSKLFTHVRSRRLQFGLALAALVGGVLIASLWWARPGIPAAQALTVTKVGCACPTTEGDPHDPAWALNFGSFGGVCIDNCKYRALKILAEHGASIEIANILHGGEYWTTTVDPNEITGSEILFQNFTSIINHVAMGFHLPHVVLKPQSGDPARRLDVPGLVISAEGVPPQNQPYGLFDALLGRYAMAYRISSLDHYQNESAALGFPLKRYDTKLDARESRRLFELALEYSGRESFQSVYQLLYNNCATTAIDLMAMARDPEHRRLLGLREYIDLERGIPATFEWGTLRRMKSEKLLGNESRY
ncbi:MAG: DUF4105 domain-containing protein [Bdellovibrionaceae bacterium]|nr:DUF4105 domain-containing protein [Pseudobdellovibrionaceae bacterium]